MHSPVSAEQSDSSIDWAQPDTTPSDKHGSFPFWARHNDRIEAKIDKTRRVLGVLGSILLFAKGWFGSDRLPLGPKRLSERGDFLMLCPQGRNPKCILPQKNLEEAISDSQPCWDRYEA